MSIERPFQISIPDSQVALLHSKLALATFPDELEDAGWQYGAPLADVKRLVSRWKDGFDWREQEKKLNEELPQFTRDIEVEGFGVLNVHYVHQRSKVMDAVPLLFVHGWPGSFIEVRKILPLLTEASPDYPSFHVVALSLPGYGFSEAPKKKGFAVSQYAEICNKLMLALGYNEYVTQGGDWGFFITRKMAKLYGGKSVKAWHTNMQIGFTPHPIKAPLLLLHYLLTPLSPAERAGLKRSEWFQQQGQGYYALQSTQPQTLGYGLADSPVGLLAWVFEKLVNWTDGYEWDDDEVLTWISIYWFSRAGPAASLRIYYEVVQAGEIWANTADWSSIPLGFSHFPKELIVMPKRWTRGIGNVVFDGDHEHGGHFAAHEKPAELVGDVRKMFGKGGPAFGVVSGRTGYM